MANQEYKLAIAAALSEPLAASRVKKRQAGGGRPALSYLETHDVIRTANSIFGFGGWGHEVVELRRIDPVTVHNSDGKVGTHVGYVCIVKLTVDGCIPTSGIGYGDATEYRESASVTAHELAAKEAESDALKRALKNYGDQFGLALYDKQAATAGHLVNESAKAKVQAKPAGPPADTYDHESLVEDVAAGIARLSPDHTNWSLSAVLNGATHKFGRTIESLTALTDDELSQILAAMPGEQTALA